MIRRPFLAIGSGMVGAGISAVGTLLMLVARISSTAAVLILLVQFLAALAVLIVFTGDRRKRPGNAQPAVEPPVQPPPTARQPGEGSLDDLVIRVHSRRKPPATAPQPAPTAPQPDRQPVELPFPRQNGARRESRPRAEVPWQPAPWDDLAKTKQAEAEPDAGEAAPPVAALLPLRPPTADDYEVIRGVLATPKPDGSPQSRREACTIVYGRRDGVTYPWLRRVADYWEIGEAGRPSILAWELLGTRETAAALARRLGLELTADELSAAVDEAGLSVCEECGQWSLLEELDENGSCTRCTS